MKTEIIAADALLRAVNWVRWQVHKDSQNRYSLIRDWKLPACRCSWWPDDLASWETPLLRIVRNAPGVVTITVRAYRSTKEDNICDGATLSPDTLPGILPAALFHDPWYYRDRDGLKTYEALADLCNVKRRVARRFGDVLFRSIARAGGCSWIVSELYYIGIRVGYPVVKPFIAAALAALLVGGCAGCSDGTFINPDDYTPPLYVRGVSATTLQPPFCAAAYSPRIAP